MEASKIKTLVIIILIGIIALLTTCELTKTQTPLDSVTQDTIFLSQWRREKKEKQNLILRYQTKLSKLQSQKDSLQNLVQESKHSMRVYRTKSQVYQNQFKQALAKLVSLDSLQTDTLTPIFDSLTVNQAYSDSACDDTIDLLQLTVANRDTALKFQKQIEVNLRDLNKEGELRNQYLTDQLNTAFKAQRKKARQNKILAGGLLILSGITTSLLLTQNLK